MLYGTRYRFEPVVDDVKQVIVDVMPRQKISEEGDNIGDSSDAPKGLFNIVALRPPLSIP